MDTDHKQRKETSCKKSAYSKPPQKHACNAAIPPMVPMTKLQLREAEAPLELPSGQWVTRWAWLQDGPHHAGGTALVRGTQIAGLAQDAPFPPPEYHPCCHHGKQKGAWGERPGAWLFLPGCPLVISTDCQEALMLLLCKHADGTSTVAEHYMQEYRIYCKLTSLLFGKKKSLCVWNVLSS